MGLVMLLVLMVVKEISYKVRKNRDVAPGEWNRCESTHEAVISQCVFGIIQRLLERDTMRGACGRLPFLFSGMVFSGNVEAV